MIKLYEIIRGIKQPLFTFYDLDDSQIRSDDVVTEGYFITAAELEQREREAFESGHKAKVREEYNSTLIKNGFVSAAGRYRDVDEAFEDYMSSKEAK